MGNGTETTTEHRFILTMPKNGNSVFHVRCACMAQLRDRSKYTHRTPVERATVWFAYDWIARVHTLDQAKAAYAEHLATGATLVRCAA